MLKAEASTAFSPCFYLVNARASSMTKSAKTRESGNNTQAPAPMSNRNLTARNGEQGSALLLCHQKAPHTAVGRLPEGKGETELNFCQQIYPLMPILLRGKRVRHQQKALRCPPDSVGSYKVGQLSLHPFCNAMLSVTSPAAAGLWFCTLAQHFVRAGGCISAIMNSVLSKSYIKIPTPLQEILL